MPARSVKITLSNNTPFKMWSINAGLEHGKWAIEPPSMIEPQKTGVWESETRTGSIFTGTEGKLAYWIENTDSVAGEQCSFESVEISWDNPYVWDKDVKPIDGEVKAWSNPETLARLRPYPKSCQHEWFLIGRGGHGLVVKWWDVALIATLVGSKWFIFHLFDDSADINLEFEIGVRKKGSIKQSLLSFYDGRKGLLSLAKTAKQRSLKTLFSL